MRSLEAALLLLACSGPALAHTSDVPEDTSAFDVAVVARLDPATHRIDASATLTLDWAATQPVVTLRKDLAIREVLLDGELVKFSFEPEGESRLATLRLRPERQPAGKTRLTVRYGGTILSPPTV